MKEEIAKLNFIEIKNLHSAKDIVKRMRSQAADWEKFARTCTQTIQRALKTQQQQKKQLD